MERLSRLVQIIIKPYTRHLLRANIVYIALFVGLIILTIYAVPTVITKYSEYQSKVQGLQSEVDELNKKQRALETVLAQTPPDLADDVQIMRTLIPDTEDYFSIVTSLEELSKKTNFTITSYQVDLTNTKGGVLSLTVNGSGDSESFLNFLRSYNFEGGRLITAKSIQLDPTFQEGSIAINVSFYSQPVDVADNTGVNYTKALERLNELKGKVSFALKQPEEATAEVSGEYPTKSNPF